MKHSSAIWVSLWVGVAIGHAQSPCVRTGTPSITIGGHAVAVIGQGTPRVCQNTVGLEGAGSAGPAFCEGRDGGRVCQGEVSIVQSAVGTGIRVVASGSVHSVFPEEPQSNFYQAGVLGGVSIRAIGGPLHIIAREHNTLVANGVPSPVVQTRTFTLRENDLPLSLAGSANAISRSGPGLVPAASSFAGILATIDIIPTNTIQPTSFTWTNEIGGDYSVAANWDANCDAPHSAEDAYFVVLPPLTVTGSGATARRWTIFMTDLTFSGDAELFSTSLALPSLFLQAGGTLFLDGTLRSQHTIIDGLAADSELHVVNGNWINAGSLRLARGIVAIKDGATASSDEVIIGAGRTPSIVGVTRDGAFNVSRVLTVGDTHAGSLEISDGGSLKVDQPGSEPAIIGKTASGTVSVWGRSGGSSARLLLEKTLILGERAPGRMLIQDGGYVRTGTLQVNGTHSDGTGQLFVGGASDGAVLDVNTALLVNAMELPEVLITNRAVVSVPELVIGADQVRPGSAEVIVRGANAHLVIDDTFVGAAQAVQPAMIGFNAPGQLTVEGGAEARLNGGLMAGSVSSGTIIVSSLGAPSQSTLRIKGDANIGLVGPAVINLRDDAFMTVDGSLDVGVGFGGGTINVRPQSFLNVNGPLTLGGGGEGRLTVDGSSFVTVSEKLAVGALNAGFLNLSGASEARAETLRVGGSLPAGTGNIELNGGSQMTITGNAQVGIGEGRGLVRLNDAASVLIVDGTMEIGSPSGGAGGGTVTLAGATIRGAGNITVHANGALTGTGRIEIQNGWVDLGGTVSPGFSPGLLTIRGGYHQRPSGVLVMEVAGLQPGQFDVLAVEGDVILGGTLEIRFLDGYLPRQGDRLEFLNLTGALAGNFAQITLPQAAPGFQAELNLTSDGKLGLIARNDALPGQGATILAPTLMPKTVLRITQSSVMTGQFTLAWTTTPGRLYRVEATDNLKSPEWAPLGPILAAQGDGLSASISVSGAPQRFYRVAEVAAP